MISRRASVWSQLWIALLLALCAGSASAAPVIEHWQTGAGARVYFVRAESIPMLDLALEFDAGGRYDQPDKAGLAALTAEALTHGAGEFDEATIADRYADIAAQRGARSDDDRAQVSLRTLTRPDALNSAIKLLETELSRPRFPAESIARDRRRIAQSLRDDLSKPEAVAERAFAQAVFGAHPYGIMATPGTVSRIGRKDVERFWRTRYVASRAVVAMVGDISRAQAEAIAEQLTRNLPRAPANADATLWRVPTVDLNRRGTVQRIQMPVTQSHVLIGQAAIARDSPDFFAFLVGNHILGDIGFDSRLNEAVREQRGLVYAVYSYLSPGAQPGPFAISLQTQRSQTDSALQLVNELLEQFIKDGPTEAELTSAKRNLVDGFALRIDGNRKILDYLLLIGWFKLPLDYLDRWPAEVERVSAKQIKEAFARHIHADRLHTVVVGVGSRG